MAGRPQELRVRTGASHDLVNVTSELTRAVEKCGVTDGIACVSVPHTTCALIVNEDEEGLRRDILRLLDEVIEPLRRKAPFEHDRVDDNAASHLTSLLFNPTLSIPVAGGRPVLGTWQSIFLVELDGPRQRTLRVTVVG